MGYCQDTSLVKSAPTHKTIHTLKCRRWQCPDCAPDRKRDLRGLARRGHPNIFLTLTIRFHQGDNPHEAARALARAWRLLRLRMKKRFKIKNIPYLSVFEKQKSGAPHLHILLRTRYLDHKWISDQMQELLDSPVVGIERIKDKNKMANYVSKYISKDLTLFKGCKRYFTSQDYELKKNKYQKPAADPGVTWERRNCPSLRIVDQYIFMGWLSTCTKSGWHVWGPGMAGPPKETETRKNDPL